MLLLLLQQLKLLQPETSVAVTAAGAVAAVNALTADACSRYSTTRPALLKLLSIIPVHNAAVAGDVSVAAQLQQQLKLLQPLTLKLLSMIPVHNTAVVGDVYVAAQLLLQLKLLQPLTHATDPAANADVAVHALRPRCQSSSP
jgi:hypothetical protein